MPDFLPDDTKDDALLTDTLAVPKLLLAQVRLSAKMLHRLDNIQSLLLGIGIAIGMGLLRLLLTH